MFDRHYKCSENEQLLAKAAPTPAPSITVSAVSPLASVAEEQNSIICSDSNDPLPNTAMKLWVPTEEGIALACSFLLSQVQSDLEELRRNPVVTSLPIGDQVSLLRAFIVQSHLLEDLQRSQKSPGRIILRDGIHYAEYFSGFAKDSAVHYLFHTVLDDFQRLDPDPTEYKLLKMIAFWQPGICSKQNNVVVQQNQVSHVTALENYMKNSSKTRTGRLGMAINFLQSLERYATHLRLVLAPHVVDPLLQELLVEEELFPKSRFIE